MTHAHGTARHGTAWAPPWRWQVLLPAYTGREEELLRDLQAQHSKRAAAAQATATAGTDQEALFDPFARSNAGWQVEPGESDGDHKPEL
jgi:hypothetical protein